MGYPVGHLVSSIKKSNLSAKDKLIFNNLVMYLEKKQELEKTFFERTEEIMKKRGN